ncbi:MAG TPA: DUF4203 domain-containing protein [Propionicimonas sp.]|jgi:hypothetical protein|uniref:TM7S3/TM198-like domain-containing protein n=1 Tax=Propionicimonas sp. TaxID=1955623 RepID=UPI002F42BE8B
MGSVWIGVIEIGLGLVFCFLGYSASRVVLGLWGAAVGYFAGSLLYVALSQWLGGGWLSAVPEWVFSVVLALVMAWLSFAFYAIGVLLSMGAVGWALGQVTAQGLHLPTWTAFALSLVLAGGLVVVGWTMNIPRLLLILITAAAGAAGVVDGIQLIVGTRMPWMDQNFWRLQTNTAVIWAVGYLVLMLAGIFFQVRQPSSGTLRAAYGKSA